MVQLVSVFAASGFAKSCYCSVDMQLLNTVDRPTE